MDHRTALSDRRAAAQYDAADNMTETLSALSSLLTIGDGSPEIAAFHDRWAGNDLVIDKWFALRRERGEM